MVAHATAAGLLMVAPSPCQQVVRCGVERRVAVEEAELLNGDNGSSTEAWVVQAVQNPDEGEYNSSHV